MVRWHAAAKGINGAVIYIEIVVRLTGTGIRPVHCHLNRPIRVRGGITRGQRYGQRIVVAGKSAGVAPWTSIQLARPQWRTVRNVKRTGVVDKNCVNVRKRPTRRHRRKTEPPKCGAEGAKSHSDDDTGIENAGLRSGIFSHGELRNEGSLEVHGSNSVSWRNNKRSHRERSLAGM